MITIKYDGRTVWYGDYATPDEALAAYRDELGPEAGVYDDVDPDWMDELEIEVDDDEDR